MVQVKLVLELVEVLVVVLTAWLSVGRLSVVYVPVPSTPVPDMVVWVYVPLPITPVPDSVMLGCGA